MCFGASDKKSTDTEYYERKPPNSSPESIALEREFRRIGPLRLKKIKEIREIARVTAGNGSFSSGNYDDAIAKKLVSYEIEGNKILREMRPLTTETEQDMFREVAREINAIKSRYCN